MQPNVSFAKGFRLYSYSSEFVFTVGGGGGGLARNIFDDTCRFAKSNVFFSIGTFRTSDKVLTICTGVHVYIYICRILIRKLRLAA